LCVQWCLNDVLIFEEREVEVDEEEEVKLGDMEIGLTSLIDKFGKQKITDALVRMSKKD